MDVGLSVVKVGIHHYHMDDANSQFGDVAAYLVVDLDVFHNAPRSTRSSCKSDAKDLKIFKNRFFVESKLLPHRMIKKVLVI